MNYEIETIRMENQSTTIEPDLRNIADMLLLNGTLTDCPGFGHVMLKYSPRYVEILGTWLFLD